jgi:hypothetical protein
LLQVRRELAAFHPMAAQNILDYGPGIFAVQRIAKDGQKIVAIHNVSGHMHSIDLQQDCTDVLTGKKYKDTIKLAPYQVSWLQA